MCIIGMKQIIVLLLVISYALSTPEAEQQIQIGGRSEQQWVQMQPIQYLSNLLHFDIALQFISYNRSVLYRHIENTMTDTIARQRQCGNARELGHQQPQQKHLNRYDCWLCCKNFKNSTYLALHYTVKHHSTLSPQHLKMEHPGHTQAILQIMNQPIFRKLSADQLNILFNSQAPPQQLHLYCVNLITSANLLPSNSLYNQLQRYQLLNNTNYREDVCTIITMKMHSHPTHLSIFKLITIFTILFVGLAYACYYISNLYEQSQRKTIKHKMY